jgi:hypothetical protein
MRRLIAVTSLVLVLVPAVALAGTSAKSTVLKAALAGKNESPKGAPAGKGTATVTFNGKKVCWKFTFSGIDKTTAAHIHKGKPGVSGPVVIPFGASFKSAGCTSASASLVKAILKNPGAYYVNIHTVKYPGGAIRGNL